MKELMKTDMPFEQVWADAVDNQPNSEIGYIRADHDGSRWWNTIWPKRHDLETKELLHEFDAVYEAFCQEFPTLNSLSTYCREFAKPTSDPTEYNLYLVGQYGYYWMRLITRYRDYNLYLHCYSRAAIADFEKENASRFSVPDGDVFTA